ALDAAHLASMKPAFSWPFGENPKRRRRCALPAHSKIRRNSKRCKQTASERVELNFLSFASPSLRPLREVSSASFRLSSTLPSRSERNSRALSTLHSLPNNPAILTSSEFATGQRWCRGPPAFARAQKRRPG